MMEGYKHTELGWIPEDWEVVRLKEVATIKSSNVDKKVNENESEVFLCNYLEVYNYDYITRDIPLMKATANESEIEKFLLKKGDVIITKDSETKEDIARATAVIENFKNTLCGYHLSLIRPSSNVDNIFLSKLFSLKLIRKQLINNANGTTRFGLTVGAIEELIILLPPLPEQQKIASILSTVDDKIEVIEQQIKETEQLKKGLMQTLLTKGIGHTKFKPSPLGEIPESWEIKTVGRIATVTAGGTPNTSNSEYWNGHIYWMNSGEVNHRKVKSVAGRITELGLKNSSTKVIPKKAILIALAGQGKTRGKVAMLEIETCINQSLAAIFNLKNVNEEFLFQNLESRYYELRRMSTGEGGRGGLNLEIIKSILVAIPPINEQQEISSILSTVDEKLEVLQEKKAHYTQLKKGLMQQLLTGKIRVNPLNQTHDKTQLRHLQPAL